MKLRHRLLFLMVFILLFSFPASAAQEIGSVSEVTGGVDILRGGKLPAEPAKVGLKVARGDVIRTKTGGKVQLHFKDDSLLTIAPDSRVAINEYVYEPEKDKREASIKIFQGLVHTVVNKVFKNETPDFTVETQTAVIGVRGTDWYSLVGPAVSDIYNNSGITEVRNIFAEIPGLVKLKGRQYTQVMKNLTPTLPLDLTQDDINWIKSQMVPKISTGSTDPSQLMSQVGENALKYQIVDPKYQTTPGQINPIQNLQSAVYVPPQPGYVQSVQSVQPVSLPTPFNIVISWGYGAQDLDLHLLGGPSYSHIDSQVPGGGEVITVSRWVPGTIYQAFVIDYTNQYGNEPDIYSTVLSSSSGVNMKLIQGGTVSIVPVNSETTGDHKAIVTGGTQVGQTLSPPSGQEGNKWTAVSINPSKGTITPINKIEVIPGSTEARSVAPLASTTTTTVTANTNTVAVASTTPTVAPTANTVAVASTTPTVAPTTVPSPTAAR